MKFNKIFLAVALCLGFVACQKDSEWTSTPADKGTAVFFPTIDETGLEIEPGSVTSYDVLVCRTNKDAELALKIDVLNNDSNIFIVPDSVVFAEGQDSAYIHVDFDPTMKVAVEYGLTLSFDQSVVSNYYDTYYNFSVTQIKYELGRGVFFDETLTGYLWYVDYKIASFSDGSKQLVVLNPYITEITSGTPDELDVFNGSVLPLVGFGLIDDKDYNFTVSIDPNGDAHMGVAALGVQDADGAYIMAPIHMFTGGAEVPGKFIPNTAVSFPQQTLGCQCDAGVYYAGWTLYLSKEAYAKSLNSGGGEEEGPEPADCVVEDYTGVFSMTYSDETGKKFASEVTILSGEDEEGQFYYLTGLPDCEGAYGYFDEKYHLMHVYPMQAVGKAFTSQGAVYLPLLLTIDIEGNLSTEAMLTFVCNEDGTLTLHELSSAYGFITFAYDPATQSLANPMNYGYYEPSFVPLAAAPAAKPAPRKAGVHYDVKGPKLLPVLGDVQHLVVE